MCDNEVFSPTLWHISKEGRQETEKTEVILHLSSLNHHDAFVLDAGETIYVWCGDQSRTFEKTEANLFAESLEQLRGGSTTHTVDDVFWDLLGGKGEISQEAFPPRVKCAPTSDPVIVDPLSKRPSSTPASLSEVAEAIREIEHHEHDQEKPLPPPSKPQVPQPPPHRDPPIVSTADHLPPPREAGLCSRCACTIS